MYRVCNVHDGECIRANYLGKQASVRTEQILCNEDGNMHLTQIKRCMHCERKSPCITSHTEQPSITRLVTWIAF